MHVSNSESVQDRNVERRLGGFLPYSLFIPLALVLVGTLVTLKVPFLGTAITIAGFAWVAWTDLAWALPLYILFSPFTSGLMIHHHHIALSDAMAIVMALALIWKHRLGGIKTWAKVFLPRAFRWPVLLLLFIALVSLIHAQSHAIAVIKILELLEFFVVVVAIAADLGPEGSRWGPTLGGLFGIALYQVLDGLEQFLLGVGPASFQAFVGHVRAYGSFGQPNVFGAFMADTLPIGLALYLFAPRGRYRPWLLVANILIAFSVWSSLSRGAWVADLAAIGLMGLFAWATRGRQILASYAAYGVALPLVLFGVVTALGHWDLSHTAIATHLRGRSALHRVFSIVHATSVDTQQRFYIWGAALRAIRTHLATGVGMGEFYLWIRHHMPHGLAYPPPHAHDIYLELGADTGLIGIIAIVWLQIRWVALSVQSILGRWGRLTDFQYAMALGALGTVTAFIVQNWVDYMIDHGVIVPLLLVTGFVASLHTRHQEPQAQRSSNA